MAGEHPLMRATKVEEQESPVKIKRTDKMLWLGSCFVESMSPFLADYHYDALVNPFGVVFHPLVQAVLLEASAEKIIENDLEKEGTWINYWLGAPFVGRTKLDLDNQIFEAVDQRKKQLKSADWLVLTWGTAFWYRHSLVGMVGKCHKFPQAVFEKKRSTVQEISNGYLDLISRLRRQNNGLKIILTVSPVRHTRDTLELNAVSKSILRLAAQELVEAIGNVFYFPAFELVVDELRDYRFFKSDLVHPSNEAVEYIWNRFENQFFTVENQETNRLIGQWNHQKKHLPNAGFGVQFGKWNADLDRKEKEIEKRLRAGF